MARARSAPGSRPFPFLALALVFLAVHLAAPGCRKSPSPAYNEARVLFDSMTNQLGDDAYGDPRMDDVERLLASVPRNSLDAPAAAELRQRISEGRAAFEERRTREAAPEAAAPEDPWASWTPPPPAPPEEDAGPPASGFAHPDVGMTVEELKARFSDCFSFRQRVEITGLGARDMWARADTEACRAAHPSPDRTLLVLDAEGKKVFGTASSSAFRYYYPDGGEAPPPAPGQ